MSIQHLIQILGYPAVFLLVMGESMGIPLPGETALLIASAFSGMSHQLSLWGIMGAGAAGAIVGDNIGYWLGRRGGRPLLEKLTGKFHLKKKHLERAEEFFARHGGKTVFFGRFVMFLRVFAALLAGVSHMRYRTFLIYNALGGIVWAGLVSFLGHTFGKSLPLLEKRLTESGWIIAVLVVLGIGIYLFWRRKHHGQ